jgi:hypothetical protein
VRKFSPAEQGYIKTLCEATENRRVSYRPINLLKQILIDNNISYTVGSDTLDFHWNGKIDTGEIISIENFILELALLLDYLEKNGLIKYIEEQNKEVGIKTITVGNPVVENKLVASKTIDPIIMSQLSKAATYRVFVSQPLRELYKNDFKSIEEMTLEESKEQTQYAYTTLKKAKCQTKYASWTLFIAIITPFLTCMLSRCCT